jgi:Bacterial TniB protein
MASLTLTLTYYEDAMDRLYNEVAYARTYARKYPRTVRKEGTVIPVLSTFVPSTATRKSLPTKLLDALGDAAAHRGTAVNQTLRIVKMVEGCGIEIIILDEFQNFIESDSNVILNSVSNWLKDLINETRKPVILVGMPYAEIVLQANPQFERRFSMRESLDGFNWMTAAGQTEFKTFLEHLDTRLPFTKRSNLTDHEIAFRIYCATNGFIGYMMKLIRRAAILAIDRALDCLDSELLAEAYEERLASGMPQPVNPFEAEIGKLEIVPFVRVDFPNRKTNRRSKAKSAGQTAANILSGKT